MTTTHDFPSLKALWSESALPEHLSSPATTSEERLARAVLDDAVNVVLDPMPYGRSGRKLRARTEGWLQSDDVDWPYSFVNISHALGVDPGWVRARVRAMLASARHVRPAA